MGGYEIEVWHKNPKSQEEPSGKDELEAHRAAQFGAEGAEGLWLAN